MSRRVVILKKHKLEDVLISDLKDRSYLSKKTDITKRRARAIFGGAQITVEEQLEIIDLYRDIKGLTSTKDFDIFGYVFDIVDSKTTNETGYSCDGCCCKAYCPDKYIKT